MQPEPAVRLPHPDAGLVGRQVLRVERIHDAPGKDRDAAALEARRYAGIGVHVVAGGVLQVHAPGVVVPAFRGSHAGTLSSVPVPMVVSR